MMISSSPITPPPELVGQWQDESPEMQIADHVQYLIARAAQWGADQELEACLEHLFRRGFSDADILCLRVARRPKPPSLKEQALASLAELESPGRCDEPGYESIYNTIRRALEALDD
jgi:hypothetical protein